MVQSSTCLNSISKFPILFWLHNFHGSQTFWVNPIISTSCLPISKTRGHNRRKDSRVTVAAVTDCTTSWSWSQTTWPSRPSWQGRPAGWWPGEMRSVEVSPVKAWGILGLDNYISITTFFLVLEDLEPIFLWKNVIARSIPRKAMACEVSVPHDDISAWASWRSPGSIERRGQSWSVQPGLCCHSARRNCRRLGWCWVGWPLASAWNFVVICVIWYLDDIWGEIG